MSHQIARNFFGWSWGWFVVRGDQMAQSIEWDLANRGPVSWQGRVGHDKDPSNLRGRQVEHRLEFCSPSLAAHYTDVPIRVKYSPTGQKAIINQSINLSFTWSPLRPIRPPVLAWQRHSYHVHGSTCPSSSN